MTALPLYPEPHRSPVEQVAPLARDPTCRRCDRSKKARTICMAPEGSAGGILLVGETPGADEDGAGRPFVGGAGKYLRDRLAQIGVAGYALANAVGCGPGTPDDRSAEACRPFLAGVLRELRPARVVALGGWAYWALTGRDPGVLTTRRGYAYLSDGTPVFLVTNPAAALRNRFVRGWFEADLQWACQIAQDALRKPAWVSGRIWPVASVEDAHEAARALRAAPRVAFDFETDGQGVPPNPYGPDFRAICLSFTPEAADDAYVWDEGALRDPARRAVARALLTELALVGSSAKYDCHAARGGLGVDVRHIVLDVRIARKILDPDAAGSLEAMSELVGMGEAKHESLDHLARRARKPGSGPTASLFGEPAAIGDFARLPRDVLVRRCARDTVATMRLGEHLDRMAAADDPNLARTSCEIVHPLARAVERMEAWGVRLDVEACRAASRRFDARMVEVAGRLALEGVTNANAPAQVARVLYDTYQLPIPYKTRTGLPSTEEEALEELDHPVARDVLEYRRFAKLKGTYADALPGYVGIDGRVHAHYDPMGARSGRLSCENPNLTNIPKEGPEGKLLRSCFVAEPGYVLLSGDFSQVELRVQAELAADPVMIGIFQRGEDYHQRTAELIAPVVWPDDPGRIDSDRRRIAKNVNFGLGYGQGDRGLARKLGCSQARASKIREAVMGAFHRYRTWRDEQVRKVRREGVVWTSWQGRPARRRQMWKIADQDDEARSRAENGAFNSNVQGSASEHLSVATVEVVRWLDEDAVPARLVLSVHDQLVLEVREDALPECAWQLRRIMTRYPLAHGIPLVVDLEAGPSWGELRPYDSA